MRAVICGTGSAVPDKVLDNEELSQMVDTNDEWIRERTGIARRHIAKKDTCVSLAVKAAKSALEQAGIQAEDIDLLKPGQGSIDGVVTHMIFKGVHYEMEVMANNYEWLVHSTDMFPVGTEVSIHVDPFDIQIMKKPESEDEEAVNIEE